MNTSSFCTDFNLCWENNILAKCQPHIHILSSLLTSNTAGNWLKATESPCQCSNNWAISSHSVSGPISHLLPLKILTTSKFICSFCNSDNQFLIVTAQLTFSSILYVGNSNKTISFSPLLLILIQRKRKFKSRRMETFKLIEFLFSSGTGKKVKLMNV